MQTDTEDNFLNVSGCSEVCVCLYLCRFMHPHTVVACPVCWSLVFKHNFFNYFFPMVHLVLAFGVFSWKNKQMIESHPWACACTKPCVYWRRAFLHLSQSSCCCRHAGTHGLVTFSRALLTLRGMAPTLKSWQLWVFTKPPCPRFRSTGRHCFTVLLVSPQSTVEHSQTVHKNESSASIQMVSKVKGKAAPSQSRAHTDAILRFRQAFPFRWPHFQWMVICAYVSSKQKRCWSVDVPGRSDGGEDNAPECTRICPRASGPVDSLQLESC